MASVRHVTTAILLGSTLATGFLAPAARAQSAVPPIRSLLIPGAELGEGWARQIVSIVEPGPTTDAGTYTGNLASRVRRQLAAVGGLARADVTYQGPETLQFCELRLTWYASPDVAREAFEAERHAQASLDAPTEAVPGLGELSSRSRGEGTTAWLRGPAFGVVATPPHLAACEALARAIDARVAAARASGASAAGEP